MATANSASIVLPLFPLRTVLFPGGLLSLKVFEPRYLDLMSQCLREGKRFGVVCLREGGEVMGPGAKPTSFEATGVVAALIEADAQQANLLQVRCRGEQRFVIRETRQETDGLWTARVRLQPDDAPVMPSEALIETARGLAHAIAALKHRKSEPFLKPFQFESAGWVANRWCEILPIPLAAKQKLMELDAPLTRLQLVSDFLRDKGVIS